VCTSKIAEKIEQWVAFWLGMTAEAESKIINGGREEECFAGRKSVDHRGHGGPLVIENPL
jgi:hypothetical protein